MPRSDDRPIVLTRTTAQTLRWMLSGLRPVPRSTSKGSPRLHADEKHPIVLTRDRKSTMRWLFRSPLWATVILLAAAVLLALIAGVVWLSAPGIGSWFIWLDGHLRAWVEWITGEVGSFTDWFFGVQS